MEISVIRPGMLTSVQDLGRPGHRASGVPVSGAADPIALRLANLLVGNAEDAAALECTLVGPELVFQQETIFAVAGATFDKLPPWTPIRAAAGERIEFGPCRKGCRAYIAVAGGIAVPLVLGSRSTYLPGGFGGFEGRALRAGDVLQAAGNRVAGAFPPAALKAPVSWHIDARLLPPYSTAAAVRVVRGSEAPVFDTKWPDTEFRVTAQSDRMGVRLSGAPLRHAPRSERRSGPVSVGTVQVPPDGQPIVLLADAQTMGGYPKLAHVISVDLPLVAQLRSGDTVRFSEVSLAEAHRVWLAREHAIAILREGLAQKFGGGQAS